MFSKGVSRRWMVNTTGVVFFILVVSITTLSLMVQSSTYNGIELSLAGRADELLNWLFINAGQSSSSSFSGIVRDYIEDFQDKNNMEIMALDQNGRVFITSTGFEPDQDQKMPDYEAALRSSSGAGKWVGHLDTGEKAMAITRVVRDENGGLVGSVRYLVSMERADQQISVDAINDMAGELGAAEQLKNDFISSVSHELRTPLTAIKGWAETLQEGAGPETTAKGMNVIIRESERLSGLVEELLDFSRLQNGRLRLIVSRLDILSELDEAVYMFTDRARTEHKQLHYEETTALPPVYGDVDRLRQVFVNIIDNALKYTSPGGTITVSSREDSGWVRVSIRDTGCGIPAEHLPNVKKKFYKANQLVRGSGIGLAVADEIARLHGGSLDIQSQEGVGTTVTISLPTCSHLEADPQLTETPELLKFIQERKP